MSAGRHPQNPQIRYLTHGHDCTPFGGLSLGFKISKWATLLMVNSSPTSILVILTVLHCVQLLPNVVHLHRLKIALWSWQHCWMGQHDFFPLLLPINMISWCRWWWRCHLSQSNISSGPLKCEQGSAWRLVGAECDAIGVINPDSPVCF